MDVWEGHPHEGKTAVQGLPLSLRPLLLEINVEDSEIFCLARFTLYRLGDKAGGTTLGRWGRGEKDVQTQQWCSELKQQDKKTQTLGGFVQWKPGQSHQLSNLALGRWYEQLVVLLSCSGTLGGSGLRVVDVLKACGSLSEHWLREIWLSGIRTCLDWHIGNHLTLSLWK